jgi:melibiose permease
MFGGGIQIISMMIFYPVLRHFINNVKIFYVCLASAITGYVVLFIIAFTGMNTVAILFIPAFFIFAANGVLQVITTVFLANTVDYGELKNSRRDESVIFSMQTFVVKLASGLAAFVASICLQINNLQGGTADTSEKVDYSLAVSASSKLGLRMTMALVPVAGLIVAVIIFWKKYILTDAKLKEISQQLEAKKV